MYSVFIYCIYISILGSNRGLHHYSVNMRVKLFKNTSFTLRCVIKEFMAFFFFFFKRPNNWCNVEGGGSKKALFRK